MAIHAPPDRPPRAVRETTTDVSSEQVRELLSDEYTRRVFEAVQTKPRTGREVIEAADVSKATAYRRLNDLKEAGLVEAELVIDPNGHHHERFSAAVDRLKPALTETDGLSDTVLSD